MAAISKSLANTLDRLRQCILEAEEKLASTPGSSHHSVFVFCTDLDDDEALHKCVMIVKIEGKNAFIVADMIDSDGKVMTRVPVLDLPVSQRALAVKEIPELIRLAKQYSDSLESDLEQVIGEIQAELID